MDTMFAVLVGIMAGLLVAKLESLYVRWRTQTSEEDNDEPAIDMFLVEKHDSTYLAYDTKNAFVAQEKTLKELVNTLTDKYINVGLATDNKEIEIELINLSKQLS